MTISEESWVKYIDDLRKVNDEAARLMLDFMDLHRDADGLWNSREVRQALIDYAYGLSSKYGEAAAELACEMYDAMGALSDLVIPAAVPAETATYADVAKAVNGTLKQSANMENVSSAVARLVKMVSVDTVMQNALRDGAEWAWIPHGDTCAFCITLASRGWQQASKKALKNGHAEHIHANCDCTYAVRFDSRTEVEGYDPDKYKRMYYDAPLDGQKATGKNRINAMRREFYAEDRDQINAQKRAAYIKRIRINKDIDGDIDLRYNNSPAKERELPDSFLFSYKGAQGFIPAHTIIEEPLTIAGKGSNNELRDVPRLVATYKRDAEGWEKRVGKVYSDKYVFDVHWYEHSGIMYEHKIKNIKEK